MGRRAVQIPRLVGALTNFTNQAKIEEYCRANPAELRNVRFIYIKPSRRVTTLYREWERFERLYYILWQRNAYRAAKELNAAVHFDYVQHLTYVTCILPTYMHRLRVPFIYGPVSGGECIPRIIKYPMRLRNQLMELVRRLTHLIPALSLNARRAFAKAVKNRRCHGGDEKTHSEEVSP